jgi:glycosyltransferase involved in cell wall biosynthesis
MAFAVGFAGAAVLTYLFNAMLGRRLSSTDFATFAALLGVLLAVNGPSSALFGGGAMASARSGEVPRTPWRGALITCAVAGAAVGLAPLDATLRSAGWFLSAASMLMLVAWARGLLIGLGRLGTSGATMLFEGVARIGFAALLLSAGLQLTGASAGLALGVGAGLALTKALLPRQRLGTAPAVPAEVWISIVGLAFVGLVQFVDVVAVRVGGGPRLGAYAAASSLARVALFAQLPAAAYAVRRTAVAGPGRAARRVAVLAVVPTAVAVFALELFPRQLLDLTYHGRYLDATGLVRVLTVAMALAGGATVLINMMLGAARTAWVWSASIASVAGCLVVFSAAGSGAHAAWAMLLVQGLVFMLVSEHARRMLAAARGAAGSVLILNWRDTRHPQGGGSEVFVEEVARRLAGRGRKVTVFCGAYPGAAREETLAGVRFVRRGSWRTVYLWAAAYHLMGRFGPHDVVVDVQNAIPFFSPMYCGRPVVVLVHHVHREQWEMIFSRRTSRIGWWVESRLSPWLYRRARYVTVSEASRDDLAALGVDPGRVTIVHNGAPDPLPGPVARRTREPSILFLGRLVPHKRIELVLRAAADLRDEFPGLSVHVAGQGAWDSRLAREAERLGVTDVVRFDGFVPDDVKVRLLRESWTLAIPSVKEGWGLAVVEAAAEGTPAVASRSGGLAESVVDGATGVLAADYEGFVDGLRRVLSSPELRDRLGAAARERAARFRWDDTASAFESVLVEATAPVPVAVGVDVITPPAVEPA